jgi:farnesyl-diphosphate farnesyltransferase
MDPQELRGLLASHARTFALTLRILPDSMREPLGIVYLLARASDTIADAPELPPDRRLTLLEELSSLLNRGDLRVWCPNTEDGLSQSEQELMHALPALLAAMDGLREKDLLIVLWQTILQGQIFDLQRFGPGAEPLTPHELDRYCSLVAGSVGVAWTDLIAQYSPRILLRPHKEMRDLAVEYGKGLQLVNILRDRSADRLLGRCYVDERDLPSLFRQAAEWLRSGEHYLAGLRPGRILMASSLPLDLALPTLSLIMESPEIPCVKLPRRSVRSVLLRSAVSLWLPRRPDPAS